MVTWGCSPGGIFFVKNRVLLQTGVEGEMTCVFLVAWFYLAKFTKIITLDECILHSYKTVLKYIILIGSHLVWMSRRGFRIITILLSMLVYNDVFCPYLYLSTGIAFLALKDSWGGAFFWHTSLLSCPHIPCMNLNLPFPLLSQAPSLGQSGSSLLLWLCSAGMWL